MCLTCGCSCCSRRACGFGRHFPAPTPPSRLFGSVSPRGILLRRRRKASTLLTVLLWHLCYKLDFYFETTRTDLEVCRVSTWFRQARRPLQPASGRLVRSARLCTLRPSRRFVNRTMDHCALTSVGTIAFCLHMVWRTALFFFFLFPVHFVALATVSSIFPVFLA